MRRFVLGLALVALVGGLQLSAAPQAHASLIAVSCNAQYNAGQNIGWTTYTTPSSPAMRTQGVNCPGSSGNVSSGHYAKTQCVNEPSFGLQDPETYNNSLAQYGSSSADNTYPTSWYGGVKFNDPNSRCGDRYRYSQPGGNSLATAAAGKSYTEFNRPNGAVYISGLFVTGRYKTGACGATSGAFGGGGAQDCRAQRGQISCGTQPGNSCGDGGYRWQTFVTADKAFNKDRFTIGCNGGERGYSNYASDRVTDCDSDAGAGLQRDWYRDVNQLGASSAAGGVPSAIHVGIVCAGWSTARAEAGCDGRWINSATPFQAQINMWGFRMTTEDTVAPNQSNYGGALGSNSENYLSGNTGIGSNFGESGTGLRASYYYMDGNQQQVNDFAGACSGSADYGNNVWFSMNPCPGSRSGVVWNFNTASFSDSASPHTLTSNVYDAAGLGNGASYNVYIDNSQPYQGTGGKPDGCGNGVSVTRPSATVNGWVRGVINVTGTACDGHSGIRNSEIYYSANSGAWTKLCDGGSAGPSGVINLSCNIDTRSFADTTTLNFYVNGTNKAGLSTNSGNTAAVTVDNNPPTVTAFQFTPTSSADANGRIWTNGSSTVSLNPRGGTNPTRGSWTVSRGVGSPVVNTYTAYRPGPSCAENGQITYSSIQSNESLANGTVAGCSSSNSQGRHTIRVWARDEAGNVSDSNVSADYYYDSVNPGIITSARADPATWTPINSFQVFWTNPTFNGTTQSRLEERFLRFPQTSSTSASTQRASSTCFGSGEQCSVPSFAIPGSPTSGIYKYRVWYRDLAGNADESTDQVTVDLYYQKGPTQPGDPCIVD